MYKSCWGFVQNKRLSIRRTKRAAESLAKRNYAGPVREFVLVPKEDYEEMTTPDYIKEYRKNK